MSSAFWTGREHQTWSSSKGLLVFAITDSEEESQSDGRRAVSHMESHPLWICTSLVTRVRSPKHEVWVGLWTLKICRREADRGRSCCGVLGILTEQN